MGIQLLFGLGALLLSNVALAQTPDEAALGPAGSFSSGSNRYIVQFSSAGSAKFRKRDGSLDTNGFFTKLQEVGKEVNPALSFTSELFHGASFDLSGNTVASVADIQALPEVEKVWEAALYTVPVTSSGIGRRDDVQFPSWSPHNQTGVAEAHALGHFGEGSLVAIVDTGVDYNHPALGGGFGPGFKIEAGYDLVGDDYVVGGPYVPDADPNDCAGHGTHVSGIVGSSEPQWLGVAPSARLRMYKVFGCGGSTYEDVIVAGFLQAYEEGPPDVITASLGSNRGFPTTALAMVATQLQAAGVFVNIAAGNAGANGPFFTSSGGNGYGSMAVGSIELSESAPAVINDFSSWGPTTDARMKPEISAPGGDIFSTYLDGGWTVLSGTSMATPYIAGVAALFFESRGGKAGLGADAARIAHETIISSASPVLHSDGTNNTAPMAQQGAGMVNALKVVSYTTSVSPGNINFNDTDHFQGSHEIKIVNSGNGTVTYQLSHAPGITINTKNNRDAWVAVFPPYSSNEGELATVQFSSDTIKLGPGESSVFTATFTEPADADPLMLPVYGGAIKVAGSNGETLSVTYLGVKGSYYQSDMWEMERGTPLFLSGRAVGGLIPEGWNYTFEEGGDYPQPYYNVLWPATELSFDFVDRYWNESDWVYPPVPGQNKFNGSFITQPGGLDDSWLTYPVVGYPRNGAFYAVPRNIFANGEDIPAGEYRILGRALRTYGDPHNLNDWQWKLSPWFNITREKPPVVSTTTTPVTTVPPTSTVIPPEPCATGSTPVTLQALVGSASTPLNFYLYSDFLAIDLTGSQAALNFSLVNDGTVTSRITGNTVFLSTHTNNNSLVYLYQPSRITGAFSYITCTDVDDRLTCTASNKAALYVCDTGSGLVRFGPTLLSGCQSFEIVVGAREIPSCSASSATTTATTFETIITPSAVASAES